MSIRQIRVGNFRVGLVGLDEALDALARKDLPPDEETAGQLLELVKRENYIPESSESEYLKALLNEYRSFLGESVPANSEEENSIKVLGPGCYACEKMEKDIREILTEEGLAVNLEHIRDMQEIARYGMLGTPSLVINGKVVLNGRSLPKKKLRELIRAEFH